MKTKLLLSWSILFMVVLASCQPATATPMPVPTSTSTPPGQMETRVAATSFAGQTATAVAKLSPFQAALTADALTAAVRTPIPTPLVENVIVPASACWMNSGVSVLMGQRVIISATGTVNTYGGSEGANSGPEGQLKYICGAIECPAQGVPYGALIGRLEDLKPFYVGPAAEFVATKDGRLYFTVNDWECQDNSGVFNLVVTLP